MRKRGFTLIELLVVIGIIALLVSIAVPVISTARKNAAITKAKTDLQTITTALEQYRIDHGDYPRAAIDTDNAPNVPVLAAALFGPGPAVGIGADGAEGFGFRLRAATPPAPPMGRIYGPYLKEGTLDVRFDTTTGIADVLDTWGNPIQYYPGRPGKFDPISLPPPATPAAQDPRLIIAGPANHYLTGARMLPGWLNQEDGTADLAALRLRLGDDNQNGLIDGSAGEKFRGEGVKFVLISGGPDGGIDGLTGATVAEQLESVRKSDDVYNFERD